MIRATWFLLIAGCLASSESDSTTGKADGNGSDTIVFRADGTVTAPESLVEGRTIQVRYAVAGRHVCPDGGEESLVGAFHVDGGGATSFFFDGTTSDGKYMTKDLIVPHGHTLGLWFHRETLQHEITCWDSNHGANFTFPIHTGSAQIRFASDGSVTATTIVAGHAVTVLYPVAGRAVCPDGGEESLFGAFAVDGGASKPLGFDGATPDGTQLTAHFIAPHGHQLALWFWRQTIAHQITCWDSNGGQNFTFPLE